ncbi:MAG TPA: Rpn family recombination-promoting nuclease/putative transposase [Myxococcales bacterium]
MHLTHDGFFKSLMEEPGAAGALLRERLPPEVVAQLAPGEPELVDGTFVDKELRETRSDRLYRVKLLTGETAFIYCLVEHKSSSDPRIGLQLLGYLTRVWERLDKEADEARGGGPPRSPNRSLPPVIALVVYHGAEPWAAPLRFSGVFDCNDEVRRNVLDFPIHLVDVGRVDESTLSGNPQLSVGLLLLKYATRTDKGDVVETVTAL